MKHLRHTRRSRDTLLLCAGIAVLGGAALSVAWLGRRKRRPLAPARPPRSAALSSERLAAVAHELRSPLNSIVGWVHVLESGQADAALTATAHRSIASSARTQGRLIEDLVDAARSDHGPLPLRLATLDIRGPIESAIEQTKPSAEAAGLSLSTVLPDARCLIAGDVVRLQQAFGNVLANAVKFTHRGGIHVAAVKRDAYVEVAVADTGQGIPPDFLPHVFDEFEQADRSARRHAGLGLGLAICRDLITRHDGTIEVISQGIGQGTTVKIRLPLLHTADGSPDDAHDGTPCRNWNV